MIEVVQEVMTLGNTRTYHITAFSCHAKHFAIVFLFFLFLIPSADFGRTAKSF